MECIAYEDGLEAQWREFVDRQPGACIGHDIAWKQIIANSLGHAPRYLLAVESGTVRGVLPLFELRHVVLGTRLVSIPVADQAGILAENDEAHEVLMRGVRQESERAGCKFIQLRGSAGGPCDPPPPKAVLVIQLSDGLDTIWKNMRPNIRNYIRKSEKGLQPTIGGKELLPAFYEIYSTNMRDLGVPALPVALFESALAELDERARLIVAANDLGPIGACFVVTFKDLTVVPCASSRRTDLHLCPNHMIFWTAMKLAADRGSNVFDFGRSTWESGPFTFKRQWGAVPVALNWEYIMTNGHQAPNFTTDNPRYQVLVRMWQHLPVPVANAIGPIISRQVA